MNANLSRKKLFSLKARPTLWGVGLVHALLIYPLLGLAAPAQPVIQQNALPTGGVLAAGAANIAQSGNTLNIQQSSQNAVINWNSFNVGSQAQVNFIQPNAQAATLNRVNNATPSIINGAIHANGQIAIVNSNGVVFGKSAQVDASAIVASTMDVSDEQFMAGGTKTFKGNPNSTAKIINRGTLSAKGTNAYIALLAPEVRNEGVIVAQAMNDPAIAIASGSQITLSFSGNHLVQVKVDASSYKSLIENRRLIQAEGGTVVIAANAASNLLASVVKNSGVINASAIQKDGGSIRLVGATVQQSGQLLANSEQGNAGTIGISGQNISLTQDSLTQAVGKNSSGAILLNGSDKSSILIAGKVQTTGSTLINLPSNVSNVSFTQNTQLALNNNDIQSYLSSLNLANVVSEAKQITITDTATIQSPNIISIATSTTISGLLSTQVIPVITSGTPATPTVQAIPSGIDTSGSSPWIAMFGGDIIVNGRIQAPGVYGSSSQNTTGRIQLNVQDKFLLMASGQIVANGIDGGLIILRSEQGDVTIQGLVQTNGGSGRGGTILAYGYSNTNIDGAILNANGFSHGGVIRLGVDDPLLVNRVYLLENNIGTGSTQGPPLLLSQNTLITHQSFITAIASQPSQPNPLDLKLDNFIEASGKTLQFGQFTVQAISANGKGYFLIDPVDVNIDSTMASQINTLVSQGYSVGIQASNTITLSAPLVFNGATYAQYSPINTVTPGGSLISTTQGQSFPTVTFDITSGNGSSLITINASITNIGINPVNINLFANGGTININAPINLNTSNLALYGSGSLNINNSILTGIYNDQLTVNHGVAIRGNLTASDISVTGYRTDNSSDLGLNNASIYNGVYIAPNITLTANSFNKSAPNNYAIQIIGESNSAGVLSTDRNAIYLSSGVTLNNNSTLVFNGFASSFGIITLLANSGNLYLAQGVVINSAITAGEVDLIADGIYAQVLAGGSRINQASNRGVFIATSDSGNIVVPNINNTGASAITNYIVLAAGAYIGSGVDGAGKGNVDASQVTSFANANGKLALFAGDPGTNSFNYQLGKLGFGTSNAPLLDNTNTFFGQAYQAGNLPADYLTFLNIFNGNINLPVGAFTSGNVAAMFRVQPTYNMSFNANSLSKVYGSNDPSLASVFANIGNIVINFGAINYQVSNSVFGISLTGTRAVGENVGSYAYSFFSSLNFILNTPSLTLNITPAPLVINGSKVFDNTSLFDSSNLVVTGTVTGENIVVSSGTTNTLSSNVGSYSPSTSGLSLSISGGAGLLSNYTIPSTAIANITKASLVVTALDDTKPYFSTNTTTNSIAYPSSGSTGLASQVSTGYSLSSTNYNGSLTGFVQKVDLQSSGAVKAANVGSYDVTPSNAQGNGISNFDITYVKGSLNVTPIALVITAANDAKVYGSTTTTSKSQAYINAGSTSNATTLSTSTAYSVTGLVNGDSVTQVTLNSDGGIFNSPVGYYPITPSAAVGTGLSNYVIKYFPASSGMLVSPATLTITANDHTTAKSNPITYGSGLNIPTTDFTSTGLVAGDSVTSVQINYNNQSPNVPVTTNVGTYTNSLYPSSAVGSGLSNYTITYVKGTVEVIKKTLTITALDQTSTYGPAWNLGYADYSVSGLVNNDVVNRVTLNANIGGTNYTSAPAKTSVGGYALTPSAATGSPLLSQNYTITYVPATYTVTPAVLTLTPKAVSRDYNGANLDGSSNTAYSNNVNNYSISGLISGDVSPTLNLSGSMAFSGSTTQSVINVGSYAYTQGTLNTSLTGTNASNYTIQFAAANSYVITPKQLTISASKTYDANTSFTNAQISVSGLVGSETINLTGTATGNSPNVIGITSLSTVGLGLSNGNNGGLSSNYVLPPSTTLVSINPASLSVSIQNNPTKTYDGGPVANLGTNNFNITGFIGSETATINQTTGLYNSPNVNGNNGSTVSAILTATNYTAGTGFVASNYLLPLSATGTGTITPAPLTITAYPSWKYVGNSDPGFTYYVTGGVNGTNPVTSADVTRINAGIHNAAGQYLNALIPSNAQGTGLTNYSITYVKNTFTIVDINQVVLTSESKSMTYGGTVPTAPLASAQYCIALPCSGANVKNFSMQSSTGSSTNLDTPTNWLGTDTSGGNGTISYDVGLSKTIPKSSSNNYRVGVYGYQVDPKPPTVVGNIINGNLNHTLVTLDENTQISTTNNSFSGFHNFLGTLTVNPATIIPTANAITKVYDGTIFAAPALSYSGKVTNDVITLNSPYSSFASKNVSNGTSSYTSTGLYLSGADAGNYILSSTTATNSVSSITPAPILIAGLVAQNKVYNGSLADPIVNGASTSHLITPFKGDTVTLTTGSDLLNCTIGCTFDTANVGSNKTVSVAQSLLQSTFTLAGTDANNYYISAVAVNLSANITPAPLYVNGLTAQNKTYDANTSAVITSGSLTVTGTVYGGDIISQFSTSGGPVTTGTFASKNVGNNISVNPNLSVLTLVGTNASNYYIAGPTSTLTAAITPKPITITGITANDKVYDTTTLAYLSNGTLGLSGLLSGDVLTVKGKATAGTFADPNVNNAITVTADLSGLNLVGNTLGNYCIASVGSCAGGGVAPPLTANITPAKVTLSGTVQYNGTTNFSDFSSILIQGVAGQTLVASSGYAVMDNANVNVAKSFTDLSNLVLANGTNGGLSRNYTLTGANIGVVNVTPAPITISTTSATKVFDGTTSSTGCSICPSLIVTSGTLYTNVSNGSVQDSLISNRVAYTYDNRNVGNANKSLFASGYAISDGNNGANYAITFVSNTSSTITPKTLTVTPNNLSKTYATNDPALTYVLSGLVATDTANSAITGSLLRAGTTAPGYSIGLSAEQVGTYLITQGSLSASNYTINFITGRTLKINPYATPLVVTPASTTKVYGTNDPTLTYTVSGFVINTTIDHVLINDDPTQFLTGNVLRAGTSAPNIASNASSENVGTYVIGKGTLSASNYNISIANATLTITPAPLSVVADPNTKVYGDSDPILTYKVSGAINRLVDGVLINDTSANLVTGALTRVVGENVGSYTINQGTLTNISSSFPGKNYTVTYTSNVFNITPAVLTVSVGDNAKFVYQNDPTPLTTLTYSGFKRGDTLQNTLGFVAPKLSREDGDQPGYYAILASGGSAANYTFKYTYTNTPSTFSNCGLINCSKFSILGAGSVTVALQPISYVYGTNSNNIVLASLTQSTPTAIYCAYPCTSNASLQNITLTSTGINQFSGNVTGTLDGTNQGVSRFTFNIYAPSYDTSNYATRVVGGYVIAAQQVKVDTYKVDNTPLSSTTTNYPNTSFITFNDGAFNNFTVVPNFLNITPLPITVTATNSVKVYDSTTLATTTLNTVMTTSPTPVLLNPSSLPFGDQITSLNYVYADPNAGLNNKIVQISNLQMTNGSKNPLANYSVTYVNNTTSSITPRPITVTADNQSKSFGSNDPSLTYTYTPTSTGVGLAPGELISNVLTGALTREKYGTVPGEMVGTYGINQGTLLANSNYALTYVPGTLQITPYQGPITVAANPVTINYGDQVPKLTYRVISPLGDSFTVNGVRLDLTNLNFTGDIAAIFPQIFSTSSNLQAGTYNIIQGDLANSNFSSINFIPATVKVNPAPLYLNGLTAQSKYYDGTTTAEVTGLVNLLGLVGGDVTKISNPSFNIGYDFTSALPSKNILVNPKLTFDLLVKGLGLFGVDASNYYIAGYAFPLKADIRQLPDNGGAGLLLLGGVSSKNGYSGSVYVSPNSLMVAYTHVDGMSKNLFPDQKVFIGDTRYVPFDGTKPLQLGIKVGTAYENINPVDYVVIPDFYDMNNAFKN